jgi:PAS domain S-box-containing protein
MTLENRVESRITPSEAASLASSLPVLAVLPSTAVPVSPPTPSGSPGPLACSVRRHSNNSSSTGPGLGSQPGPSVPDDSTKQPELSLEESWEREISRHGLTPPSTARHLPGDAHFPSAVEPSPPPPASPDDAGSGVSPGHLGKRSAEVQRRATPSSESPSKKPRLVAPGSLRLPPQSPATVDSSTATQSDLSSQLFFSNSPPSNHMPGRPSSFKTLDATPSIMGTVHEPHEGVTILRLPKGQVSAASPPRSSGTPASWASNELTGISRSPEGRPLASPAQLFHGIGLTEFLEADPRPAFVVDLDNTANFDAGPIHILYANAALRSARHILEHLNADTADPGHSREFSRFKAWAIAPGPGRESPSSWPQSIEYGGVSWTYSTLRKRFRFLCGNSNVTPATPSSPSLLPLASSLEDQGRTGTTRNETGTSEGDYFGIVGGMASPSTARTGTTSMPGSRPGTAMDDFVTPQGDLSLITDFSNQMQTTFDWTRIPLDDPNLGTHHRLARSINWGSTSLGPVEEWPADLRILSNMIMGSPHPAAMYWGPDHVAIYNQAYVALAGEKHPGLMGSRYQDAWSEIWTDIGPVLERAWNNGDATMKYDDLLFITRNGYAEETYFNWALIPLVGGDGNVVAVYNPAFENTRRKISERRMLTLREIGVKAALARDFKGFWAQVLKGLEYNDVDVPFALVYSVDDGNESEVSSMHSGSLLNPPQIVLEGSLGVPDGHPCAVSLIDLRSSEDGFGPYMRDSMSDLSGPIVLSDEDDTLPAHLLEGLAWRGFGDPCRTIVIFPVHPTTAGDSVVGFIVLGINPRRPYDADYQLFVSLLSRQLATSMASVVLFEEEIKRGQRAARLAALDRQELSMQLHLRTQEAVESEYRFSRMAEFGPVGMFITNGGGHITYCNEMWWKISGHQKNGSAPDSWMQSIRDEDRAGVESVWRRLVEEKLTVTHEFRFNGSRLLKDGHSVDNWALMSAYPEKDEYGALKSIFGCITDIAQQKWAEDFQKRRRDEAVELKRQQENFIDITSHEMRNPLSAILQCADEISSCLNRHRTTDVDPEMLDQLIDSCVEAANTISLCASHQKRIVDDILTLSKLDSNLLLVTPVDVQPVKVVQNVLKMFETELVSHDIKGAFRIEDSFTELGVDWVKLDPSRLRQVMINLMTNAIKFTQGRAVRTITISLGASKDGGAEGLSFIPPRRTDQKDITDAPDWADGEKLFLHVAVTDTGPGLDDDEKKILFQRFSQVSPRTHVQYGGSGLGLFICRILTEMQGGQIGVQSDKGDGSTFAFYIKIRKSNVPQHGAPDSPAMSQAKPLRLAAAAVSPQPGVKPAGAGYSQHPANIDPARKLDVLIVEDNLVNQKVLQRQLQLSGNKTHVANHGGEALSALRQSRFWDEGKAAADKQLGGTTLATSSGEKENKRNISVILMDLEMPVMDGISCTKEIRRLESLGVLTQHIPIIAVTAYARPEQIENAKAAGVASLPCPFSIGLHN